MKDRGYCSNVVEPIACMLLTCHYVYSNYFKMRKRLCTFYTTVRKKEERGGEKERGRGRDRQRDRDRQRQTDRDRHRQRETETISQTDRDKQRQTVRQTDRNRDRERQRDNSLMPVTVGMFG